MTTNRHINDLCSWRRVVNILLFVCVAAWSSSTFAINVEKWKQYRVEFNNPSWSGNPFDLEFTAVFKHTASGKTLRQFGFYAENNTWKIYFMPDQEGEWTYTTFSTDPELNNKTGSFNCIKSNLKGKLVSAGNRWQYENGESAFPIVSSSLAYLRGTTLNGGIRTFIDWLDQSGINLLHPGQLFYFKTTDVNVGGPDSLPYKVNQHPVTFNMTFWDRMNSHFDYLRDKNMGHYIMFYSDDSHSPLLGGIKEGSNGTISAIEERLFKYTIARFGAYPMVVWDSGIDISEYRSNTWIDNFVAWMRANDPWEHPVSSRSGGGSGGKQSSIATYWSDGVGTMPGYDTFYKRWNSRSVPTMFTDRFREDGSRGNFNRTKIREAVWQNMLTGATGLIISANNNAGYLGADYKTDFKAAPEVGYAQQFFKSTIINKGGLTPQQALVDNTSFNWCSAVNGLEYVVYMRPGNNGTVNLNLSNANGPMNAFWYDPTDGSTNSINGIVGGNTVQLDHPGSNSLGNNDWVLYVTTGTGNDTIPPETPILDVK